MGHTPAHSPFNITLTFEAPKQESTARPRLHRPFKRLGLVVGADGRQELYVGRSAIPNSPPLWPVQGSSLDH